ncbi:hypothetical protein TBLA_0D02980 [Henningerozyma blattae CBS 6284]|uniref:Uncharacterized protein n=1 Tax=Henningerozyma blattae (strain ATCC 34711 / CBS 6284 / DSM 70876 / NBRC 10599 / NRRL Y-10934 / UCD 77-7) TaxID=1071380 RepID=I2H346_HENB6|nr:hypothetical protein TBLA_0D02980 [Tetrapisispora blattae CBS 6284]CCH60798.1 hypothetical protein TBLA_0D02980 [Tetrapisispora blattae CBS 6284]
MLHATRYTLHTTHYTLYSPTSPPPQMSGYFSNFSLDKLADSLQSAAQKTQDTLSNAIQNVNIDWNDPQTRLTLLSKQHYLQESIGQINEISKLPSQYNALERKTDALEKIIKRILIVTNTFEIEGYDYPPNLSESISEWWLNDPLAFLRDNDNTNDKNKSNSNPPDTKSKSDSDSESSFLPRSFPHAISKASSDSSAILTNLNNNEKLEFAKTKTEDEEYEDDEDIQLLIKVFDSWSLCNKNIDKSKFQRDQLIIKQFNKKLTSLLDVEFKNVKALRLKVQDARLKFDTMRYEIAKAAEAKVRAEENDKPVEMEKGEGEDEGEGEGKGKGKGKGETASTSTETASTSTTKDAAATIESQKKDSPNPEFEKNDSQNEDEKLLEHLEDEFVSHTSAAVETMEEITESSKILDLIKLFQNFQLLHYQQCIKEVETNMKLLTDLTHE